MSLVEVQVPQLSESVAEATLLQWKKQPGQPVTRDEVLVEIETDKVVLEVPAPSSGVLAEIVQPNGATVTAQQLIARIDTSGAASTAATVTPAAAAPAPAVAKPSVSGPPPSAPASAGHAKESAQAAAMPAAAKMMMETGVSPSQVQGSGRDGRITKGDVLSALEQRTRAQQAPAAAAVPKAVSAPAAALPSVPTAMDNAVEERTEQRVPMSRLRARVAERLVQSQSTNAILTTFNEVNMQPVMELRKKYQERFEKEHGVRLGFMSFFVKAAIAALKRYPILNASVDGNDIVYHGYFDIGIAVGSPRGLVVPILRDADRMTMATIEKTIAEYGEKAKNGKLSIEELTGGTFSISNGGVFGSMLSTPIINPPQSAILGIHATKERPVVENGQIVIRPMNYLAMSYDHRIIDGREAVLGLVAMKEALEDPARLLLEI